MGTVINPYVSVKVKSCNNGHCRERERQVFGRGNGETVCRASGGRLTAGECPEFAVLGFICLTCTSLLDADAGKHWCTKPNSMASYVGRALKMQGMERARQRIVRKRSIFAWIGKCQESVWPIQRKRKTSFNQLSMSILTQIAVKKNLLEKSVISGLSGPANWGQQHSKTEILCHGIGHVYLYTGS